MRPRTPTAAQLPGLGESPLYLGARQLLCGPRAPGRTSKSHVVAWLQNQGSFVTDNESLKQPYQPACP